MAKQQQLDPIAIAQAQTAREQQEVQIAFQKGITALRDFIAPSSIEFKPTHFLIGTRYARTYYTYGYPHSVYTGWLSTIINLDEMMDISLMIYPVESQVVLESLRKKVGQLEAGIQIDAEKGRIAGPFRFPARWWPRQDRPSLPCVGYPPILLPAARPLPGADRLPGFVLCTNGT